MASKQFKADFYCFEEDGNAKATYFADLLDRHTGGFAPPFPAVLDPDQKYQIRSIRRTKNGNVFKAVFGRLRMNEGLEQGDTDGHEATVDLKPGYGLVEKNHFLFYRDLNLVVFQRNGNAGRYTHLQDYLNRPTYAKRVLVPVLTQDSYARLMEGGEVKKIEISVRQRYYANVDEDAFLSDYAKIFQTANAGSGKITLSAHRGSALDSHTKNALIALSKFNRTRIARATLQDDNEIIDLIADRIVGTLHVELDDNRRPDPRSMFVQLAKAKDDNADQLRAYFGP